MTSIVGATYELMTQRMQQVQFVRVSSPVLERYSDASGEIEDFYDGTFCFCPRSLDMEHSFRCPFLSVQGARFL